MRGAVPPRLLAIAAPDLKVHALAYLETPLDAPFDEVVRVPPTPRADPCDQFRRHRPGGGGPPAP